MPRAFHSSIPSLYLIPLPPTLVLLFFLFSFLSLPFPPTSTEFHPQTHHQGLRILASGASDFLLKGLNPPPPPIANDRGRSVGHIWWNPEQQCSMAPFPRLFQLDESELVMYLVNGPLKVFTVSIFLRLNKDGIQEKSECCLRLKVWCFGTLDGSNLFPSRHLAES